MENQHIFILDDFETKFRIKNIKHRTKVGYFLKKRLIFYYDFIFAFLRWKNSVLKLKILLKKVCTFSRHCLRNFLAKLFK